MNFPALRELLHLPLGSILRQLKASSQHTVDKQDTDDP